MSLIFASSFDTPLGILKQKKVEIERLLQGEYNPKCISGLLDHLEDINARIRAESRKHKVIY